MSRMKSISDVLANMDDRSAVWDALWSGKSINRIAVGIIPSAARVESIRKSVTFEIDSSIQKPDKWTSEWDQAIIDQLYEIAARAELPGDHFPALYVPRFVHGQSQGITDLFDVKVEAQPDGNYFTYPLPADPSFVDDVTPLPIEKSMYWGAVEWMKYAHTATGDILPFRNPVMTGPIDTANYLLGSTTLLEWVYTEPDVVHNLLQKVTGVIIDMQKALREASGGNPNALHFSCTRGGFDLCSEVRSLLSKSIYEEFEAPYLKQIGEACGPFGFHSCGSWERTIPSVLDNSNIRAMNGQIRENDLQTLCDEVSGRKLLSIAPSINVHTRYMWADTESFLRHILEVVPDSQPFEINIAEDDIQLWNKLHLEIKRIPSSLDGKYE